MLYISDIKESYNSYGIPQRLAELLPEFCDDCGSPLHMTETLTMLSCSNPRCKSKVVMRIRAICKDLNILDFGESKIEAFVDYYGVTNPLDFFELKKGMSLSDSVSQKVSDAIILQLEGKKDMLLWEYVMYANLPYIRTSSRKIFQGYKTLEDAYRDIEDGGVPFIQEKLGVGEEKLSIQAAKVYHTLMEFKEDLLSAVVNVRIMDMTNTQELNVVCSDQVGGGFTKKSEFYDYVNKALQGRIHVNFLPSVSKSIDYLVWAGADGSPARYTSKVSKVEGYNQKGCNIPIVTATQFLEAVVK